MKSAEYIKAYQAGYKAGYQDGCIGLRALAFDSDGMLPVEALGLSVRAANCLTRAGCKTLADVAGLTEYQIKTMRNLGPKTAAEVTAMLHDHDLCQTCWEIWNL